VRVVDDVICCVELGASEVGVLDEPSPTAVVIEGSILVSVDAGVVVTSVVPVVRVEVGVVETVVKPLSTVVTSSIRVVDAVVSETGLSVVDGETVVDATVAVVDKTAVDSTVAVVVLATYTNVSSSEITGPSATLRQRPLVGWKYTIFHRATCAPA
jgi:hypothetical protein